MNKAVLIEKAEQLHRLKKSEIAALLSDNTAGKMLAEAANRVRKRYVGDGVLLRGLIEFSSYCRCNCCYCGLRRDNGKAKRFRMSEREIIELAGQAKDYGYQTVVLQSGEDAFFSIERLGKIIEKIKELDLAVTLSIGERSFNDYKILREAGADRFLLRIETTDAALYTQLNPGMSYTERVRCLKDLRSLGYEVGTGSLVGLPGQTIDSLADDILFFQKLDADMIGIGPLVTNPDTPLDGNNCGDVGLTLRMLAVIRLLLPEANIPATTALETLEPGARIMALTGGANVIMPNVTVGEARMNYALYPGKAEVADTPQDCNSILMTELHTIGRYIENSKGFRKHRH